MCLPVIRGMAQKAQKRSQPSGNLDVAGMWRCSQGAFPLAGCRCAGSVFETVDKILPVEFSVDYVDFRNLLIENVAVSLGKASHSHYLADFAGVFQFGEAKEEIDGFLFGIGDESAGIDHHIFPSTSSGLCVTV